MNVSSQYDIISRNIGIISNPLVADMYVKREYDAKNPVLSLDVLVIETSFSDKTLDSETYSDQLTDLLIALPEIQTQVEGHVGMIDRVDIRTH